MNILDVYHNCQICPRSCGADRCAGSTGYCAETSALRLALAGLHFGEEPPLSGQGGSGTLFVCGCNLQCYFCQNWQISHGRTDSTVDSKSANRLGRIVSEDEFAAICLELQNKAAQNINIVTGSHAIPAIAIYLAAAYSAGLTIPVLWNSSAYESPQTLELLYDKIDTWLPDLKTLDTALAAQWFNAPDYPQAAAAAIQWMMQHKPGKVIIRHLIIPGHLESTRTVLSWFAENATGKAQLSLMSQYTPVAGKNKTGLRLSPNRFLGKQEYETVLTWLNDFNIEDGFCQELHTGSDWLPDFNRKNPFSSDLSVPVWHFSEEVHGRGSRKGVNSWKS